MKQADVDMYAPAIGARHVVYSATGLSPTSTHTIEVRVLGTRNASATNSIVDVDGFLTMP